MLARIPRAALRNAAVVQRQRLFSASAVRSEHTLPPLEYAYDALEPHISSRIMTLHHTKHHKAYVDGLNAAEKAYASTSETKDQIKLQAALKFNGGGKFFSRLRFKTYILGTYHYKPIHRPHQPLLVLEEPCPCVRRWR